MSETATTSDEYTQASPPLANGQNHPEDQDAVQYEPHVQTRPKRGGRPKGSKNRSAHPRHRQPVARHADTGPVVTFSDYFAMEAPVADILAERGFYSKLQGLPLKNYFYVQGDVSFSAVQAGVKKFRSEHPDRTITAKPATVEGQTVTQVSRIVPRKPRAQASGAEA